MQWKEDNYVIHNHKLKEERKRKIQYNRMQNIIYCTPKINTFLFRRNMK